MDIRQLRYVVAVARTMHFTHAAEKLGVAQPALSQAIALLERQLSVVLFDRNSRRVQLTAAGQFFVERAEKILSDLDRLESSMTEHAALLRGQVKIGTMVFFFFGDAKLARTLAEFRLLHPGVEIDVDNNTVDDTLAGLRSGKIDIALLNLAENLNHAGLDLQLVDHDDIVAALPPTHRLAGRPQISFSELSNEFFVVYRPGSTMHDVMSGLFRNARFTPKVAAQSRNIILVRSLVSEGIGVSIGPKSYLTSPGPPVAVVPISPPQRVSIAMVTRSNVDANPATRALVTFLRQSLRSPEGAAPEEKTAAL